jgi:hypothetical protein
MSLLITGCLCIGWIEGGFVKEKWSNTVSFDLPCFRAELYIFTLRNILRSY